MMPRGQIPSQIMIVGDTLSYEENRAGSPFLGYAGESLRTMLQKAGISLSSCFLTCAIRTFVPYGNLATLISYKKKNTDPDLVEFNGRLVKPELLSHVRKLKEEIALVQPDIIIALGEAALFILTGNEGVKKWRGSMLHTDDGVKVIPTYSPVALNSQPELRYIVQQDFRQAVAWLGKPWPKTEWDFTIRPTFDQAINALQGLIRLVKQAPLKLSIDIETYAGHIACIGIAWSKHEAICIPFTSMNSPDNHYWQEDEETEIVFRLRTIMLHPNCLNIGQNYIYDCQYFWRSWHFHPTSVRDTMTAHHTLFPGMQKSLDFICSFHNEQYVYWKDDGKTISADKDEDKHWRYNCLTGDTKVLMGDASIKELKDIQVGDCIMSFEEYASGSRYSRKLKKGDVTKVSKSVGEVLELRFSDGTVLKGTHDHRIFRNRPTVRKEVGWSTFKDLEIGSHVFKLGATTVCDDSFISGWMSGILDGEGTLGVNYCEKKYHQIRPAVSQKKGLVYEEILKTLEKYGFHYSTSSKANAEYIDINGGLPEYIRLLQEFPTKRLQQNFEKMLETTGCSGFSALPRVQLVEVVSVGICEVYDITTTLGTFIANGLFVHNCEDCVRTYEADSSLQEIVDASGMRPPHDFQQSLFVPVLKMMNKGVNVNKAMQKEMAKVLEKESLRIKGWIREVVGYDLNPKSPKQMQAFFYGELALPRQFKRAANGSAAPTCDSPALAKLAAKQPRILALVEAIEALRSIEVYRSNYTTDKSDIDGRMRCSYNINGTKTFRFSSSENAFGSGLNLQTIPK